MRIERDHDRCTVGGVRVPGRGRNHGLMTAMNSVEDADGEKERAGEGGKIGDGMNDLHLREMTNDECRMNDQMVKKSAPSLFRIRHWDSFVISH